MKTLELRKDWNNSAPASQALPTEIWRESITRHQRCHALRDQLRAGEVTSIDQFITLNLDIRQFAQDLVDHADASLLLAFFKELKKVSVLDPTCGSGAFLFAALEILEPLYLGCIERMRTLLADWESSGEKHPNWKREITTILDHVDSHPNESYYIHKTIIVHNLYGVDIMEEAVEICKLRLFLKLAAQLEQGQEVEPLPDIDFNICAGNTLVGYSTEEEIRKAVENDGALPKEEDGREQGMMIGIVGDREAYTNILEQAEDADRAFQRFHQLQEDTATTPEDFRTAKRALNGVLNALRQQLDRFLAVDYNPRNLGSDEKFEAWQNSHEPFHWFIEFYGIINAGGFSSIIGNPPYVEMGVLKQARPVGYQTESAGNIYALVMERCFQLVAESGYQGFIVPVSSISTDRYEPLQRLLSRREHHYASFDDRPSRLFDRLEHIRITIHILGRNGANFTPQGTRYYEWYADERPLLFEQIEYSNALGSHIQNAQPKVAGELDVVISEKLRSGGTSLGLHVSRTGSEVVYYSRKVGYFLQVLDFQPKVRDGEGNLRPPSEFKALGFSSSALATSALAVMNSSLFYWFITFHSDCRHLNRREVIAVSIPVADEPDSALLDGLSGSTSRLMAQLKADSVTKTMNYKHDTLTIQCIYPKNSKPIVDQIDNILAAHYGFTEEELDFIINYDIKYRMGLGNG